MRDDRHIRQRLLAQVGDAGQTLIATAGYAVSSGDGAWSSHVERDYLERAGALNFSERLGCAPAFPHASHFQHEGALELASGAWRALLQIRAALEKASP